MKLRFAQYGTKHGHAAGKLAALRTNPYVELSGVFEPDSARQRELQASGWPYSDLHWYTSADEMLRDPGIIAIASEGGNHESLAQTEAILQAGKHVWYDKPAGDDWAHWQRVVALAEQQSLLMQMGYMFRYHNGFRQIADWVHSGLLGDLYALRAHMSTWIEIPQRQVIARHTGGIFYDLAGHMLDQIVWLLGRPNRITSFLHNHSASVAGFSDNTLAVLEYPHALAYVDIAAIEAPPTARRFEVYGSLGSAVMEPFEPADRIRLCLTTSQRGYSQGEQSISIEPQERQELYDRESEAFVAILLGNQPRARTTAHDLLVQETLLRATGVL